MINYIWLIFAHVIGDFVLQTEWLAHNKGKFWLWMLWHSMIWSGCICIILDDLQIEVVLWKWLFLIIGHFIIDKCRARSTLTWHALTDQALHLLQCWIVYTF